MNANKKLSFVCYGITLCIFLAIFLWGILGLKSGDEMGYCFLNFYLIMPLTSLIMGIILGIKNAYLNFLYPIVFGGFGFVIPGLVFRSSWDLFASFFSLLPALLGLLIGLLIWKIRTRK